MYGLTLRKRLWSHYKPSENVSPLPAAGEPDFMARTIMFTFSSSVIATIVSIPIIDDLLLETDREQFISMLTLVTSDPDIILQPASVPIEIIDNDGK